VRGARLLISVRWVSDDRSDRTLLSAHAAGDRYAFEELLARHRARLHGLARRRSRSPEDADDILQDALLSAHRTAGAFRHDAAVGSWLHRIVVNACIDRGRRHTAHSSLTGFDPDRWAVPDRTGQVETTIVVRQALMRLPAEQRAAVIAVDMHGYSVADAAALLGVAQGTVKSRCARARARLAVLLRGTLVG